MLIFTTQIPTNVDASDGRSYELGMKFSSAKAGKLTAIRYWKAASETGAHRGNIWAVGGTLLATVAFTNETASGWQEQALSTPLDIQANTTYVVSVNCNSHFSTSHNQLANSITNGDLSTVADGNNGVYGDAGNFPTHSFANSNYFRDVVFVNTPSLAKVSGDNQSGRVNTQLRKLLVVKFEDANGNPQPGCTVNFSVTSGAASVSPTSYITDSNGKARTAVTLGAIPSGSHGVITVQATVVGGSSVTFSAKSAPANANPIHVENLRPGTSDWQITNYAKDEILGYATATSVNKGGSLPLKISLANAGNFRVEVYRLGFYGGLGGRLVLRSDAIKGITQPPCTVVDEETHLVECHWSTSCIIAVSPDWASGLYIAKLIDLASAKQSAIWFVVRDDASHSDILFQSSFTSFQAYNNYGGYSLYSWNSPQGKATKVSFDRPYIQTTSHGAAYFDSMIRFERHMVRWLESQGYDVSYITNLDVQNNLPALQQHKVFLSVGHDEYWTMEERNLLEQARDANPPVNLAFFSANTAYWHVRLENSTKGQANRVMVCYKDNSDPKTPLTNKFRLIDRPENALLGVMYTGDDSSNLYNTASDFNRPIYSGFDHVVSKPDDPYYANTGLNRGDKLIGLVGFEWDAVVTNEFSPNGLVTLSQSSVVPLNNDQDLPPGTNLNVSNAVRYTTSTGAKVFATGTNHWMFGLDDGGNEKPLNSFSKQVPVDPRVKQITVNILADMGAKPQTPNSGIIVPSGT